MDKYINIVLTSDKNYTQIIGVTMTSILHNISKSKTPRFFLFTQDFSQKDINEISKLKNQYNCEIINVPMENYIQLFNSVDTTKFKNNYISLACYFRLLMLKILPEDVEQCFYIDGDMIVECDLSEINLPEDKLFAAVIEPHAMQYKEKILDYCYKIQDFENFKNSPNDFPYFNAGFFLLNVKLAKKLDLFTQAMDFLQRNPNPPYADQDILNAIIGQKYRNLIEYLPPEYNLFANIDYYKNLYDKLPYEQNKLLYATEKVKIYHYAGQDKPWNSLNIKNFYNVWWKYYQISPWNKFALLKQCLLIFKTCNLRKFLFSIRWNSKQHYIKLFGKYLYNNKFRNNFISIIVTSYNYENYIRATLDSILNQTYQNFEVIIVDDGSTDNSVNIIKEYTNKYKNFHLYTHENNINKGLPKSIELGLSKCKGEYIAFLESDDYWDQNYLQEKINFINKYKKYNNIIINDIQTFGGKRCDEYVKTQAEFYRKNLRKSNLFKIFYKHCGIPTFSQVMIKKDILLKCDFNAPIQAWLDFWLWRQVSLLYPIGYIDKKLTHWRIHENSFVLVDYDKNNDNKKLFRQKSNKLLAKKYPIKFFIRKLQAKI